MILSLESMRRHDPRDLRCTFKVGDRIRLTKMENDPCPVEIGTTGTVSLEPVWFQNAWTVGVKWDNGRTLNLLWPVDQAEKI